ncbi:MAG TPA: TonB family protein [Pyrinomonadaceae bacterium]|jgi:TonB family protein|nr:TonB family protein [Pyrinomonadaceae bacterium]
MKFRAKLSAVVVMLCALAAPAPAQTQDAPRPRVAVLDFGDAPAAHRAADELAAALQKSSAGLSLVGRAQARAAAKGAGYAGSLNLSLEEARDLGGTVGADFFFAGEADAPARRVVGRGDYFEAYASLYLVSAFTGKLILWERLSAEAADAVAAERDLISQLRARARGYAETISKARAAERDERRIAVERDTPVVEDVPDEGTPAAKNFRVPLPYRRLRPPYPEAAARAEVEATVDALVELDELGEVQRVEIVRWAGYGLDESVAATIRQMHFRPALSAGAPVAARVLLRYNFRKPKEDSK